MRRVSFAFKDDHIHYSFLIIHHGRMVKSCQSFDGQYLDFRIECKGVKNGR